MAEQRNHRRYNHDATTTYRREAIGDQQSDIGMFVSSKYNANVKMHFFQFLVCYSCFSSKNKIVILLQWITSLADKLQQWK